MENALKLWEQVKDMLKASNDEATFNQTFAPITDVYKVQNNIIYLVAKGQKGTWDEAMSKTSTYFPTGYENHAIFDYIKPNYQNNCIP